MYKNLTLNMFFLKSVNYLKRNFPFHCINDKSINDYLYKKKISQKYSRKYKKIINECSYCLDEKPSRKKVVWFCWLQGIDQAPKLVRKCYENIKNNLSEYEVVIITEDNFKNYISIPQYIIDKWKKGIIYTPCFTDIIRINLLIEYGGLWIDSTVLFTGDRLPKYIDSNLFMYKCYMNNEPWIVSSNWLIAANKNNPILKLTRDLLYKYYEKRRIMEHYFMFHLLFALAANRFKEEWEEVPLYNNVNPHMLVRYLNIKYDEDRYLEIKKISDFHKLNYKMDFIEGDTFYNKLMKE